MDEQDRERRLAVAAAAHDLAERNRDLEGSTGISARGKRRAPGARSRAAREPSE
jgi:hypothetical protein